MLILFFFCLRLWLFSFFYCMFPLLPLNANNFNAFWPILSFNQCTLIFLPLLIIRSFLSLFIFLFLASFNLSPHLSEGEDCSVEDVVVPFYLGMGEES